MEITLDGYLIKIKNRIILTNNFTGGSNATLTQLLKDNGATTANFFTNAIDTLIAGYNLLDMVHIKVLGLLLFSGPFCMSREILLWAIL